MGSCSSRQHLLTNPHALASVGMNDVSGAGQRDMSLKNPTLLEIIETRVTFSEVAGDQVHLDIPSIAPPDAIDVDRDGLRALKGWPQRGRRMGGTRQSTLEKAYALGFG